MEGGSIVNDAIIKDLADKIREFSNGTIVISFYHSGPISPLPTMSFAPVCPRNSFSNFSILSSRTDVRESKWFHRWMTRGLCRTFPTIRSEPTEWRQRPPRPMT